MIPDAFLHACPKTDLHLHLDGSLRLETLIEIARAKGVALPSYSPEGLRQNVFREGYQNLEEYLQGFSYTCAIMDDPETIERIAFELAEDCIAENVCYLEIRFAPMLHIRPGFDMEAVLCAVDRGLARAKRARNEARSEHGDSSPPFEYGIIACAMRFFDRDFSPYFQSFCDVHPHMPKRRLYGVASLELVRGVVRIRDKTGIPIVGVDLAGAEDGFPAEDHVEAFALAHQNFMKKTVHAGEAYGAESIFQAITLLHADRIGHGYHLFDARFIRDPQITDRECYIERMCQFIAENRITIEVCLSSNKDTDPSLASITDHPFKQMLAAKLSTTICTDNRLVSRTTATRELKLAVEHFGLDRRELEKLIIYGFKRGFFPGPYTEKRAYVRRVIDYYRALEKQHGLTD